MQPRSLRTLAAVTLFAATLAVTGCSGGDSTIKAETTTTGQQLLDLKKAYEAGAMSEKEYKEQREKILDK